MKTSITLLVALVTLNVTIAQNVSSHSQLPIKQGEPKKSNLEFSAKGISPFTAFLITDLKMQERKSESRNSNDSLLINKYGLMRINNILYANAFLLTSDNYEPSELSKYGFLSGSQSGQIMTGLIPIDKIIEISNSDLIKYIQIGEPAKPLMDAARAATWVNEVHAGTGLPQSYFGNGVVVGIIDGGFDYTHPNFYDGTGSNNYRIKRVWEQNGTGTPPAGYSYGRELSTQTSILNAQKDISSGSHGSHVTGIAAGAGGGASTTYMGVAPQSDVVLVSYGGSDSKLADAISYIMNYASSVNKPCVINMSLGKHIGPHDGNSAFDQYCDGIVGQGKLLVGAAGNEGSDALYYGKSYTSSDTVLYSFVQFPSSSNGTNGETVIDIWGNQNQNFWVAVNIYNTNTNSFEDWTPYIAANSPSSNNYTLYDDDTFVPDACSVTIATEINGLNNKPRVLVSIDHTAQDDSYRWVMIEIIAYNTQTKMWAATAYNGSETVFTANGKGYPWVNGSTSSTMGEIGGTGKNIITVGAYTSKNSWTALNASNQSNGATNGAIADFSSKGPTADGRTKPDITAPGNVIVSSVNRFDSNYPSSSNDVVSGVTNGTNNWYFATMQGTSMASPMVTGILALWLQAYPNLTPTQAKTLLKDNAWTDSYTGTIPVNGSNTWGWGKVDAQYGLIDLLTKIPAQPTISPSGNVAFCQGQNAQLSAPSGFTSYQWSNNATTQNITVSTGGNYTVRVTNSQGYISPWSAPKIVTVNSLPANAGTISGSAPVCQGQNSVTYTVPTIANATSYVWTLPSGATGASTTNSITVNYGTSATSGNITVKGTNTCGNGSTSTYAVTVNSLPASAGIITGTATVCQGQNSVTYTVPTIANATSYVWTLPSGATGASTTNSITVNYGTSAVSGNITVKGTNSCGNGATSTYAVTVNNKPITPVITLNGNVLHSDASSGNQWYNQSGFINGASNQDYTVSVNGDYYVIVTLLGCSSEASNTINVVLTGIEVVDNDRTIKVYPNPVLNELVIEIKGNNGKVNFDILNAIGQVVFKGNLVEKTTVQTSNFAPGVYLIKLENGKTFEFKKIIKE
jgi:subtilisin family serine protease